MNEPNSHGWHASSGGRVSNNHYLDILVAERLWASPSQDLFGEKAEDFFRLLVCGDFLVLTAVRRGRVDNILAKEFVDRTILGLLPLSIHKLGRSRARVT